MFSLVVFKNSPYSCFYYDKYMIDFQFFVINTSKEARIFVKANVVFIENNYHHNTLHIFLLFSSGTSVDYLFDKKSLVPPDFRICKYKLIIIVHLRCNVIVYILRLQDITTFSILRHRNNILRIKQTDYNNKHHETDYKNKHFIQLYY